MSAVEDPFHRRVSLAEERVANGIRSLKAVGSATPFDFSVMPLAEVAAHETAWRALANSAAEPNPFYRPDFLLPIVDYLQPTDPRVLLVRKNGRLTGAFPLVRTTVGFGFSGRYDAVYYHDYGPVGTPLVDRDMLDVTADALYRAARREIPRGLIMHLDADGPVFRAMCRAAEHHGLPPFILDRFERAALDATQDIDHFRKTALTRKKRKELARQYRRLSELGPVRAHVHTDRASVAGAFERYIALEALGWKGRRETALGSDTGRMQHVADIINAFALGGRIRIDEVAVGNEVIASLISFVDGNRLFTWKIAYREDFARYSPGNQLILGLTGSLLDDPAVVTADSLAAPDHPMIDHLWRERLSVVQVYFPLRRGLQRPPVLMQADRMAYRTARSTAKHLMKKLNRPRTRTTEGS